MSTKICVTAVKPGWKDAVTLGQLQDMMIALNEMGYDQDTPVTYLYDNRHVWLETVHDMDDDGFDIEVSPEPRVWESAQDVPDGVVVRSHDDGTWWKWENGKRYCRAGGDEGRWDDGWDSVRVESMLSYAPFTEVLGPQPRVVDSLGVDERFTTWVDKDGDSWRWSGARGWQFCRPNSTYWTTASESTLETAGPFAEVLS